MKNKGFVQLLRILLSALFVFSGIAKILSLDFFDKLVAELFIGKDYFDHPTALWYVKFFTRFMIAGEIMMGAAILQEKVLKKVTLPVMFGVVMLFTVHLFYAAIFENRGFGGGNCGCFGELVPMDNLESIIKNIVSMVMIAYIWWAYDEKEMRLSSWVMPFTVGTVVFLTLYLTIEVAEKNDQVMVFGSTESIENKTPIDTNSSELTISDTNTVVKDDSIKITKSTALQQVEKPVKPVVASKTEQWMSLFKRFSDGKETNLNEGRKIVSLFNLTCGHCQATYKTMVDILKTGQKLPPIYLINYGKYADQEMFFSKAGGQHPNILVSNLDEFSRYLGGDDFPKIIVRNNGVTEKVWTLQTYSDTAFANYFGVKLKVEKDPNELNIKKADSFKPDSDPFGEKDDFFK